MYSLLLFSHKNLNNKNNIKILQIICAIWKKCRPFQLKIQYDLVSFFSFFSIFFSVTEMLAMLSAKFLDLHQAPGLLE